MSLRWASELGIPGNPDISSVHASYVLACILAIGLLLSSLTGFWPWFTVGILAVGFQIPLLIGIVIAKFRTSLPTAVGHAKMFPNPEPYEQIGWLKALGGFLTSAAVIAVYAVYAKVFAV